MAGLMDFLGQFQNPQQADIRRIDNALDMPQAMPPQGSIGGAPWPVSGAADVAAQVQPAAPEGFMDKVKGYFGDEEQMARLAMGFNSMRMSPDQALAAHLSEQIKDIRAKKSANMTLPYIEKFDPALADLVKRGAITAKDAIGMVKSGQASYGLTPIEIVGPNGEKKLVQLSNTGGQREVPLPEGWKVSPKVEKVDAGTHWVLLGKDGTPIGTVPKELAKAAAQTEVGKAQGQAIVAAPSVISGLQDNINQIDNVLKMKNFNNAFGLYASQIPTLSQDTADVEEAINQVKGGAFLAAIQQMRGLGSLSNAEGEAATRAISNLSLRQSPEMARTNLMTLRQIMVQGQQRAQSGTKISADYIPDYLSQSQKQSPQQTQQQPESQDQGLYNQGKVKTVNGVRIVEIGKQ